MTLYCIVNHKVLDQLNVHMFMSQSHRWSSVHSSPKIWLPNIQGVFTFFLSFFLHLFKNDLLLKNTSYNIIFPWQNLQLNPQLDDIRIKSLQDIENEVWPFDLSDITPHYITHSTVCIVQWCLWHLHCSLCISSITTLLLWRNTLRKGQGHQLWLRSLHRVNELRTLTPCTTTIGHRMWTPKVHIRSCHHKVKRL